MLNRTAGESTHHGAFLFAVLLGIFGGLAGFLAFLALITGPLETTAEFREWNGDFRETTADFREMTGNFRETTASTRKTTGDFRETAVNFRENTANFRENAANFREMTANFREKTANFREMTADFRGLMANFREKHRRWRAVGVSVLHVALPFKVCLFLASWVTVFFRSNISWLEGGDCEK